MTLFINQNTCHKNLILKPMYKPSTNISKKSLFHQYPWSKVEPWVNRWTFSSSPPSSPSPPPPPSHHQIFVSLRYRKRRGGGEGEWSLCCVCNLVYLKILTSSRRERWPLDSWPGVLRSEPPVSCWTESEFTPSVE